MDHERDDSSMDDTIGRVPPSINVGHMNARFHLSKMSTSYSAGALLENDQNLLETTMIGNGGISTSAKSEIPFLPTITASSNTKRTLSYLYWNDEDVAGTSSKERFNLDGSGTGGGTVVRAEENGTPSSIATLLNHLPQTPSLHQQPMVGSIGDGLLRAPYQLQVMNWYD